MDADEMEYIGDVHKKSSKKREFTETHKDIKCNITREHIPTYKLFSCVSGSSEKGSNIGKKYCRQ